MTRDTFLFPMVLLLAALPARAELLQIDLTVFGMD